MSADSEAENATATREQNRRWQFSLRSLLLVFLLVASFCAGRFSVTQKLNQMREEADRQRANAMVAAQRAQEAVDQLHIQLAQQTLAEDRGEAVRAQLLKQANQKYEDFHRFQDGDKQVE